MGARFCAGIVFHPLPVVDNECGQAHRQRVRDGQADVYRHHWGGVLGDQPHLPLLDGALCTCLVPVLRCHLPLPAGPGRPLRAHRLL